MEHARSHASINCNAKLVWCVMQGIALSADPNYKVLGAAYPWIARRLLTEQSIELRDTLHTLLYKKGRFQVCPTCLPCSQLLLITRPLREAVTSNRAITQQFWTRPQLRCACSCLLPRSALGLQAVL